MRTTTLGLSLAVLTAGASSEPQPQIGKDEVQKVEKSHSSDCVLQSIISGFEPLDDRHIVLFDADERKAYLAEMAAGCFNIEMQTMFSAVDGDRNGQICGDGRDSLAYRRVNLVQNCLIVGLEELSDERRLELGVGSPHSKSKKESGEDEAKDDAK
jgi:hypothetical protein